MTAALPFTRPPHRLLVEPIVRHALEEDLGRAGDVTSELTVPAERQITAKLVARKTGTIRRADRRAMCFRIWSLILLSASTSKFPDGSKADAGALLATIEGSARSILTAERVALNFVGHLSGIATAARALVDAGRGHEGARIVETRKTTPGLRLLEKYAVRCGGGFNHRFGLDDAVLIKDNHIVAAGGIAPAIERVRAGLGHMAKIELEVDSLDQLEEALALNVDTILLDNMSTEDLKSRRRDNKGPCLYLRSLRQRHARHGPRHCRRSGVDYISSGAITHSATNLDVGLDL